MDANIVVDPKNNLKIYWKEKNTVTTKASINMNYWNNISERYKNLTRLNFNKKTWVR